MKVAKVAKVAVSISALALIFSTQVWAQNGIRLGSPSYGGSGCPGGTASVSVAPDEKSLSILFDQFITEAGGTTGRRLDRKSCNLSIPVQVPQGYSVALFQVDYRGFHAAPAGAYNRFDAEYFWAGIRGPRVTRIFNGPASDLFTVTDNLVAQSLVWTPCGASVNLRVNANMMSMANSAMQQTMASIDSADVSAGLIYHIQWRRCF